MILREPFKISSRLLPSLTIGGADVQLEYVCTGSDGRIHYQWTIDLPDGQTFTGDDLRSGCQGGNLLQGFESLFAFLTAAAESYKFKGWDGENAQIFPKPIVEWAATNIDDLGINFEELTDDVGLDALAFIED